MQNSSRLTKRMNLDLFLTIVVLWSAWIATLLNDYPGRSRSEREQRTSRARLRQRHGSRPVETRQPERAARLPHPLDLDHVALVSAERPDVFPVISGIEPDMTEALGSHAAPERDDAARRGGLQLDEILVPLE